MTISYISDPLIQGIGATLVHSIWQGLLVALLLRLALYLMPQSRVQLKYWLSVTALTAVVFWAGYTFNHQVFTTTGNPVVTENHAFDLAFSSEALHSSTGVQINILNELLTKIELASAPYHNTMVVIWVIGVVFFLIRLQGSIFYLQRMKQVGVKPVPTQWQQKVQFLSQRLGIRDQVRIVESKLAEVPMVIGHLKPVILIPVGMINGLSVAEVEAILTHELAHIKRYDYLVNIVQTVIESLLFFNPAVWWISQTIRKSREHCCDDLAVKYCGDQLVYANALSNLGAWSLKTPALSMGLFKNKNELLMRIKRLVYPQVGNQTVKERLFPGLVLTLTVLCLSWYSHRVQAQLVPDVAPHRIDQSPPTAVQPDPVPVTDSIPAEIQEEIVEVFPPEEPVEDFEHEYHWETDLDIDVDVDLETFGPEIEIHRDFGDYQTDVIVTPPVIEERFILPPSVVAVPEVFAEVSDVLLDLDVEVFADPEQFEHVVEDFQIHLDDTTRERIMQALEEQRAALERAREEQTLALEKAREQLRKSLEGDRPEDLTEEEWEMAKREIERAELSLEQAMRSSERALERALQDQDSEFHRELRHAALEAEKNSLVIRKQLKHVNKEQLERQLAEAQVMARVHQDANAFQHQINHKNSGAESKLRKFLWKDGLIDDYDSDICLVFSRSQIKVNGVKLEGEVKQKYRDLLNDMYGENSTGSLTFSE